MLKPRALVVASGHCSRGITPSTRRQHEAYVGDFRFARLDSWTPVGRARSGPDPLASFELHDRSAAVGDSRCDLGRSGPYPDPLVAYPLASAAWRPVRRARRD